MTHDKLDLTVTVKTSNSTAKQLESVRQDFEALVKMEFAHTEWRLEREFEGYRDGLVHMMWTAYQAGRAAERAEIREKLESEETVYEVAYALRGLGWKDNAERAKAAITKILEVI